jgi:hypothetical protein
LSDVVDPNRRSRPVDADDGPQQEDEDRRSSQHRSDEEFLSRSGLEDQASLTVSHRNCIGEIAREFEL